MVDHRWCHPHLQLCNRGGGNIHKVDRSDDSGGDGGGGGEHHRDHHHPPRNHFESQCQCRKRRKMLILAHHPAPVHLSYYDLSIIRNHHQLVHDDDDDYHGHNHGDSHHDCSLPWPGSDWTVEVVGRAAKAGSTGRQRSLCKCTCL